MSFFAERMLNVGRSQRVGAGLDPERAGKGHCHILVEGLDDFFKAYQATGHKVIQPPKLQSWGMKDAVLADSDGNTVEVAERIVSPLS